MRFAAALGAINLLVTALNAEPDGTISSVRRDGIILTSLSDPEFFIFRWANNEEHFDGTTATMEAQGGFESGEPIVGLHYLRPRLAVNGPTWSEADRKLLDGQFRGAATGNFYLFKTIDGQLFILPKEGETAVVRMDYRLRNGRTVTVWMRK